MGGWGRKKQVLPTASETYKRLGEAELERKRGRGRERAPRGLAAPASGPSNSSSNSSQNFSASSTHSSPRTSPSAESTAPSADGSTGSVALDYGRYGRYGQLAEKIEAVALKSGVTKEMSWEQKFETMFGEALQSPAAGPAQLQQRGDGPTSDADALTAELRGSYAAASPDARLIGNRLLKTINRKFDDARRHGSNVHWTAQNGRLHPAGEARDQDVLLREDEDHVTYLEKAAATLYDAAEPWLQTQLRR